MNQAEDTSIGQGELAAVWRRTPPHSSPKIKASSTVDTQKLHLAVPGDSQ